MCILSGEGYEMRILVLALLLAGCAPAMKVNVRPEPQVPRWDIFYMDSKFEQKVVVIPAERWRFEDGCFIAERPIPYIRCEVVCVRPCLENCE